MHKSLILLLALLLVSVKAFKPKSEKSGFLFRFFGKPKFKKASHDMPQETLQYQIPTVKLSDFASSSFPHVPLLITQCIAQIHRKCPLFTGEGQLCDMRSVFRVSAESAALKDHFIRYITLRIVPEVDYITCGGLIKMFLRKLEGGIMDGQLEECMTSKVAFGDRLNHLKSYIEELPTENRETLATLMIDAYEILDVMVSNADFIAPIEKDSSVKPQRDQCRENLQSTLGMAMFENSRVSEIVHGLSPAFKDDFSKFANVDLDSLSGPFKALGMIPAYVMSLFLDMGQGYWTELLAKGAEITERPDLPQLSGSESGSLMA